MELSHAKMKLRDARPTPVHYQAFLGLVDAVIPMTAGQKAISGQQALALLRRTIVDLAREAGAPV
jgi:hypothetical protein